MPNKAELEKTKLAMLEDFIKENPNLTNPDSDMVIEALKKISAINEDFKTSLEGIGGFESELMELKEALTKAEDAAEEAIILKSPLDLDALNNLNNS